MCKRTYVLWLVALYLAGVSFFAVPLLSFMRSDAYTGLLPIRSPDEGHYVVRMQAHVLRPFDFSAPDGVWFTPESPPWLQVSLIEYAVGSLFGWTGLNALQISWLLMTLCAPLSMPLIALLARRTGAGRGVSLAGAGALFVILLGFSRMFHPSISFPVTAAAFLALWAWWDVPSRPRALLAGAFAGALMGVYLWSLMFIAATWVCLLVLLLFQHRSPSGRLRWSTFPFVAAAGILAALPALTMSRAASAHPLFAEVSDRMGLLLSRTLESPPRSLILLALTVLAGLALRRREDRERFAPLLAAQAGLFLVYNQQLLHGRIISFSSHTYSYVCLTALLLVAFAIAHRAKGLRVWALGLVACVPLIAAARDYELWKFPPDLLTDEQTVHLGPAIDRLNQDPPGTILSDGLTSNAVGATTHHGVAFIEYARILLIRTQEYTERYCLSEALTPGAIDTKWVADFQEERSRAGLEHTKMLYEKHLKMAERTCPVVQKNLGQYLKKYHVTTLLWNELRRPDWKIPSALFTREAEGDGWSLWQLKSI